MYCVLIFSWLVQILTRSLLSFLYVRLCIFIFASTCLRIFSFITVFQQCDRCVWVYLYSAWHLLNFLGLQIYNFHPLGIILAIISPNNFSYLIFSLGIPTTCTLGCLKLSHSCLWIFPHIYFGQFLFLCISLFFYFAGSNLLLELFIFNFRCCIFLYKSFWVLFVWPIFHVVMVVVSSTAWM